MSRVPADTVLIRLAIAAVIALPLSGCGGDDPETATTPAAAAATTPVAPTTAAPKTPDAPDAQTTPPEPTREEAKAAIAETKKAAKEAGQDASPAKQSTESLTQQVKRSYDALKAAGMNVGKPIVNGEDSAALTVENGTITIAFFRSPRLAAMNGAATKKAFEESPQQVEVVRKANRLFLLNSPTEFTAKQLDSFKEVRQVVNAAA